MNIRNAWCYLSCPPRRREEAFPGIKGLGEKAASLVAELSFQWFDTFLKQPGIRKRRGCEQSESYHVSLFS